MPDEPVNITQTYEQQRDKLHSFFRALARRKDSVDDMMQEVYVELVRYPPREALRDPTAYLYKVAWHLLQRFNKRARQEPVSHDLETLDRISGQWSDDAAAEVAAEQQLIQLLRELPPVYGAVLLLNRRDGLRHSQIASRLGISTSQVRRYLGRTLAHIKGAQWGE